MENILIPVSLGELYDKISILEIKRDKLSNNEDINNVIKLENINKELKLLNEVINKNNIEIDNDLYARLKRVNNAIWGIEDNIRTFESKHRFDEMFISLARSVYINNDERSSIKREINELYNSNIIEEKIYQKY
ncbi:DUF6165 family protein [bacterium]|jgi:hypothetical protein|nr:DUF6165 family protein [bacterium]